MRNFEPNSTTLGALLQILKADTSLCIWSKNDQRALFSGKVYQLYDDKELHGLYVEKLVINLNHVGIIVQD